MTPPVLLIIFNRPAPTAQVMGAIRAARPERLYIAADGPRPNGLENETDLCAEARRVAIAVDWPCQVRTLFGETNLGCRFGPSTAIDWFFEHEEEGIILEDDCVPSQSFFPYCAELLGRYRDDKRIMSISGNNYLSTNSRREESYFFSHDPSTWGWATWRRAWLLYDGAMTRWSAFRDSKAFYSWSDDVGGKRYWTQIFDRVVSGQIDDAWDYQWIFSCWLNGGLSCHPRVNLVRNIGFGDDATHTRHLDNPLARFAAMELAFPLVHPRLVEDDIVADVLTRAVFEHRERPLTWLEKVRFHVGLRTRLKTVLAHLGE